ncbi:MAG: prepilin peptidase [Acidimicrobiales bacterium]|nr:prepilin peptidase [Acidimicrobiales bacterium]
MATSVEEAYIAPGWLEAFLPRRDRGYLGVVVGLAILAAAGLGAAASRSPALVPACVGLGLFGVVISAGDVVTRRIPNKLNAVALASSVPLLVLARTAGESPVTGSLATAALGALAAFAAYLALWLAAPAGMGMGDVKLSPYLGAHMGYFGWSCWTNGMIYGFLIQGAIVLVALATRKLEKKSHVAHGPAMCLGAALAVVVAL